MTLVLSQPAAEIPFGVTVAVWVIGERILSLRDLRSGAWKSRQDAKIDPDFEEVTEGEEVERKEGLNSKWGTAVC